MDARFAVIGIAIGVLISAGSSSADYLTIHASTCEMEHNEADQQGSSDPEAARFIAWGARIGGGSGGPSYLNTGDAFCPIGDQTEFRTNSLSLAEVNFSSRCGHLLHPAGLRAQACTTFWNSAGGSCGPLTAKNDPATCSTGSYLSLSTTPWSMYPTHYSYVYITNFSPTYVVHGIYLID